MPERFVAPVGADPAFAAIARVSDLNAPQPTFAPEFAAFVSAVAGDFKRVAPRATGMTVMLESPSATTFGKSIALYVANALGALTIRPISGTINGAASLVIAAGTTRIVRLWSDGVSGWVTGYPGAVANADLAPMPANTLKGNATGATATPQDIAVGENQVVARSGGNITPFTVAASRVVGRGAAGNLTAMTPTTLTDDMVLASSTTQAGKIEAATAAEVRANTIAVLAVCPDTLVQHLGVAKSWVKFDVGSTDDGSYNVAGVSDDGNGIATVTIDADHANTTYAIVATCENATGNTSQRNCSVTAQTAGTYELRAVVISSDALSDPTSYFAATFGDIV